MSPITYALVVAHQVVCMPGPDDSSMPSTRTSVARFATGIPNGSLRFELPAVGAGVSLGGGDQLASAYGFGAAASLLIASDLWIRAGGSFHRGFGATETITWFEADDPVSTLVAAQTQFIGVTLGIERTIAAVFDRTDAFVGADVGLNHHTFEFRFDESLRALEQPLASTRRSACVNRRCAPPAHDSVGIGPLMRFRAGARSHLTSWLSGQVELSLSVFGYGGSRVTNTVTAADVRSSEQVGFLAVMLYSLILTLDTGGDR